jgi:hypothetical protein
MIRLNTPIESLVINLQSAGNVQYNIQYVIVRQGTRLEKSTEGLLTSSGQNVVLINDFSSGYFDITYINVTNIDPTENFISVLKKTNVSEFNLTSEAIGLKNRECTEFTSESGFKVLDQNGSFKTITESVSADGDVENSDMTYMASVPSGGTLTLPDSDIEVNGVGEGQVVSVKTISVDLNDGVNPVSPTLVTLLGNTLTITLPDIGDVTIENSDATYQVVEPSGGTLVLPDSQINVNGVDEGDVVSVKAINVDLTDGVDPVVPTSVGLVGNTLTITLASSGDVDIEINGVPFDTIAAPATVDIPVINSVPAPVGTITGTDIIVADSSAVIKDSVGTTLKTEAIPAEASENITINNSTVNIRDTAANLLHSVSVRAEATTTQDIADTTVENSDASYSVNVLAEGSLILPDSQINVNSVDRGDVVSVKTIDVNLEDSLGDPVTPTSVGLVGNTLTIEVASGGGSYDIDTTDRFGNVLPTIIVSADTTLNWQSYDFADLYLSRLTNPPTGAQLTAVYTFFDNMITSGLFQGSTNIQLCIGGNAADHSWNARYPFDNNSSMRSEFIGSPTHNVNGVSLNGTTQAVRTNCYVSYLDDYNKQISIYSRNNIINPSGGIIFNAGNGYSAQGFGITQDSRNRYATEGLSLAPNTTASLGLLSLSRESSTVMRYRLNAVNQTLSPYTGAAVYNRVTEEITIGAFMTKALTYSAFKELNYCYFRVGNALTDAQETDHYNIVQALQTAFSRNV